MLCCIQLSIEETFVTASKQPWILDRILTECGTTYVGYLGNLIIMIANYKVARQSYLVLKNAAQNAFKQNGEYS